MLKHLPILVAISLVSTLLLTACPKKGVTEAAAAPEPKPWHEAMRDRLALANGMRNKVILADMKGAKADAAALAAYPPPPGIPDEWAYVMDDIRRSAQRAADADNLLDIAIATGDVVASCGRCHAQVGARPGLTTVSPDFAEGDDRAAHMSRHKWANDQLWQGLLINQDELWQAGAQILRDEPIKPNPDLWAGWKPEMIELDSRVHALGTRAAEAAPDQRPDVFGDILAACAECHATILPKAAP